MADQPSLRPEAALAIPSDLKEKYSNWEVEGALLGSVLIDAGSLDVLMGKQIPPDPAMFTYNKYRELFKAMLQLYDAVPRRIIDFVTITEQLRANDALEFVTEETIIGLIERVPSSAHVESYFAQVLELHTRRLGIALANRILQESTEGDYDTLTNNILSWANLFVNPLVDLSAVLSIGEGVDEGDRRVQEVRETGDHMIGIASGFAEIDEFLGGFPRGELSVVIADTSIGKTQFGLQVAVNAANAGSIPLVFSMEMTAWSLALRMVATRMQTSVLNIRRATLTDLQWEAYDTAREWVKGLDLFVDDTPAMSASDLRARAMRSYSSLGIELVLVDYLQLIIPEMNSKGDDWGYTTVTHSMRELHTLARSLDAHVMVLANTHRGVAVGSDKRPEKHHGSGSGAIEKYADYLFGLYRHSVYVPDDPLHQFDGEFRVLKFRNGPTDDIRMGFIEGRWTDFSEVSELSAPADMDF